MSDNEDWRRRKAEELGLVDTGPRPLRPLGATTRLAGSIPPPGPGAGAERRSAPAMPGEGKPFVHPVSPKTGRVDHRAGARPTAAAPEDPQSSAQATRMLVLVVGLALAMLLGWWLRGAATPDNAAQMVTGPAVPPTMPASPASTRESAMPDMPDMVEPERAALPDAVPVPPPVRILPTAKRPLGKSAEPAPVAVSKPPRGRHTAPRAVAAPGRNFSPSFNCRRATSFVNRMICNDRKLAALDVQMSTAYGRAVAAASLSEEGRIDAAQTQFLNRRGRCTTATCLDRVYRSRIRKLGRQQ